MNYTDYLTYQTLEEGSEQAENLRNGDTFCLIPSSEEPAPAVKGRPALKSATGFTNLNEALPEEARLDGTEIYHGVLLGGVVAQLDGEGEGGQGTVNPPEVTPTPTPVTMYTVTYLPGNPPTGVSVTVPDAVQVAEGSSHSVLEPTYDNTKVNFMGWKDDTGTEYSVGRLLTVNSDINLTAQWEAVTVPYTLTWDAQGDLGHAPNGARSYANPRTINSNESYNKYLDSAFSGGKALSDPNGQKTFKGWHVVNADTNDVIMELYTANDMATPLMMESNVKATAVWEAQTGTYSFAHGDVVIGTVPSGSVNYTYYNSITINASYDYAVGSEGTVGNNKYIFKGWQLYRNGTEVEGVLINSNGTIPGAQAYGNLVLKTVWESMKKIEISFMGIGFIYVNDSSLGAMEVFGSTGHSNAFPHYVDLNSTSNTSVPIPGNIPTANGYEFVKWAMLDNNDNFVKVCEAGGTLTLTPAEFRQYNTISLYPLWKKAMHTITFDPVGASGTQASVQVEHGTTYTVPKTTTFTFTGWNFAGWAETPTGSRVTSVTVTSDMTLYAMWTRQVFVITLNKNDGSNEIQYDSEAYGAAYTPTKTFTRTGYELKGWSESQSGGTLMTFPAQITRNMTLYAQWEQKITGDYIPITQASELSSTFFAQHGWDKNYKVMNNIDCSSTSMEPIGWTDSDDVAFTGTFDGNGMSITNYNLQFSSGSSYVGLFAKLGQGAVVKNLNINCPKLGRNDIGTGLVAAGVITGENRGTIQDIEITVGLMENAIEFGGAVGINRGDIINVHVNITNKLQALSNTSDFSDLGISKASAVGGIAGISRSGSIRLCSVQGVVNPYHYANDKQSGGCAGGIVGIAVNTTIDQCWFTGSLNNYAAAGYGGWSIGGIVGYQDSGTVSNCWAVLDYINGYDALGGIAGEAYGKLSCCFAYTFAGDCWMGNYLGAITNTATSVTIENCYYENDTFEGTSAGTYRTIIGATYLPGFDTSIWEFQGGDYLPGLINNPARQ